MGTSGREMVRLFGGRLIGGSDGDDLLMLLLPSPPLLLGEDCPSMMVLFNLFEAVQ